MSINGVMGELGQGLTGVGDMYMKEALNQNTDERHLAMQKELQQQQSDLMVDRMKAEAEWKNGFADKVREQNIARIGAGVADIAGKPLEDARNAYQNSSGYYEDDNGNKVPIDMGQVNSSIDASKKQAIIDGMRDPNVQMKAAIQQGDYASAKALADLAKKDLHNVPYGQMVIDSSGKEVYSGGADLKRDITKQIEDAKKERADERNATTLASKAMGGSGRAGKPDVEVQTKVEKGVHEQVDRYMKDRPDPYAPEEMKDKRDRKFDDLARQLSTDWATMNFQTQTPGKSTTDILERLDGLDSVARQYADQAAAMVFDDKGKVINGRADLVKQLEQQSGGKIKVSDPNAFKSSLRNSLLNKEEFALFAKDPAGRQDYYNQQIQALKDIINPPKKPVNKTTNPLGSSSNNDGPGIINSQYTDPMTGFSANN